MNALDFMQRRHRTGFAGKSYALESADGVSQALDVRREACRPQTPLWKARALSGDRELFLACVAIGAS